MSDYRLQYTPRFISANGASLVSASRGILKSVALTANGAASSLAIFDNATSAALSLTTARKLVVRAAANTTTVVPDVLGQHTSGLVVSMGTGAYATLWYGTRGA